MNIFHHFYFYFVTEINTSLVDEEKRTINYRKQYSTFYFYSSFYDVLDYGMLSSRYIRKEIKLLNLFQNKGVFLDNL